MGYAVVILAGPNREATHAAHRTSTTTCHQIRCRVQTAGECIGQQWFRTSYDAGDPRSTRRQSSDWHVGLYVVTS